MQKLIWQNANGDTIDLTSGNYGITEWEGFSNAGLNVQSQQVPFQDGAVFLDALIEPRELSVTLAMQDNNNLELRYQLRRELIHILNPKLGEGYLIYTNDYTSKRIKCIPQIPLFQNKNSNDSGTPKASLAWTACEPYWEDLEETSVYMQPNTSYIIENKGDVDIGVKIEGETSVVSEPVIDNLTQGKNITLDGLVENGFLIDTNNGEKKVLQRNYEYMTQNSTSNINKVIYAPDKKLLVAVGYNGLIMYSRNAKRWTNCDCYAAHWESVAYSEEKNLFVVVGGTHIAVSNDLKNWQAKTLIASGGINSVSYSKENNLFIAVGYEMPFQNPARIFISSNGLDWEEIDITELDLYLGTCLYCVKICNGNIVAVGENGTILTSQDCITWVKQNSGVSDTLYSCSYGSGKYVAVGAGGVILTSSDLQTWVSQTSGTNDNLYDVDWVKNKFIIAKQQSTILKSNDGTSWSSEDTENANNKNGVTYSEYLNKIVIVGNLKTVMIKELDYGDWDLQMTETEKVLKSIVYAKNQNVYICVGEAGTIKRKDLNNNWVDIETAITNNINSVTYSELKKRFVLVGDTGLIATSEYGNVWTIQTTNISTHLYSVVFKDGVCFAVGASGVILKSSDLISWEQVTSGVSVKLNCIIYARNLLVACGESSTVLISSDGVNWTPKNIPVTNDDLLTIIYIPRRDIFILNDWSLLYITNDFEQWDNTYSTPYSGAKMNYSENANIIIFLGFQRRFCFVNLNLYDFGITFNYIQSGVTLNYAYPLGSNFLVVGSKSVIFEINTEYDKNIIQKLDPESDMELGLKEGLNNLYISMIGGEWNAKLSYRQKYIGV